MKVTITVADDTGQAPVHDEEYSTSSARGTGTGAASGRDAHDAGSPASAAAQAGAAAPGNGQVFPTGQSAAPQGAQATFPPGPSLPAVDAGAPPDWLSDLVQLAEAGQVPRPGEEEPRGTTVGASAGRPAAGSRSTPGATDAGSPAQPAR